MTWVVLRVWKEIRGVVMLAVDVMEESEFESYM
jgi:hypothetical protein